MMAWKKQNMSCSSTLGSAVSSALRETFRSPQDTRIYPGRITYSHAVRPRPCLNIRDELSVQCGGKFG